MYQTFAQMIDDITKNHEYREAYKWFDGDSLCIKTYGDFRKDSANLLEVINNQAIGTQHIGLIGTNSYGWAFSYLSILASSHVMIPLDKDLPETGLITIINMADIDTLIVCSSHFEIIKNILPSLHIKRLIYLDERGDSITISAVTIQEDTQRDIHDDPKNLKVIMFTSGTTGTSKGVMLSESNLLEDCYAYAIGNEIPLYATVYNILPMHHIYPALGDIIKTFYIKGTLCININQRQAAREIRLFNPVCIQAVPLIATTFIRFATLGVKNGTLEKASDFFGKNFEFLQCGGANVPADTVKAYKQAGIKILRGYGLTECAAVVTGTNAVKQYPDDITVGRPLECNQVRIVDSEIQIKGKNVMLGYYKNPEATKAVFDGEWFKTGDIGYMKEDNLIYITGRSKNIIVLSNGKNIYPEEIEEYFLGIPGIDELVVFEAARADNDNILAAIIYSEHGDTMAIKKEIDERNQRLPLFKNIVKVIFTSQPLDKTTSKKILRPKARERAIQEIILANGSYPIQ